jgi:hypothetical protein
MWRCSRYGKEGFIGEIDLHPRLSWIRGHPCILKNMDPLKVSCYLFIRKKLVGRKRRGGQATTKSYNGEEQGQLFCLGEGRRHRRDLFRPALRPLAASDRTALVSFQYLALLFATI